MRKGNKMILYLFSSNSSEQKGLVQQLLQIKREEDVTKIWTRYNSSFGERETVRNIRSIQAKNRHQGIPGYWLKIQMDSKKGVKKSLSDIYEMVGNHRINGNVFYPRKPYSYEVLEKKWQQKYCFQKRKSNKETYGIFFQEIKGLMKENQFDNAYYGLLLLLQHRPSFLKKYHRDSIFEDLSYQYDLAGDFHRAEKCLRIQMRLMPDSPLPALNMSNLYLLNEMMEKAMDILKASLKKHPSNQYLMHNYIMALGNVGDTHLAVDVLKKALEKDMRNSFYWKLLADLLYEMEDVENALQCYRKALRGDSEEFTEEYRADTFFGMAACFFEKKQYKPAKDYYLKVLKTFPEDHYTLMNISQICFYHLKESEEALKYAKQVAEKGSESGYLHYQMGLIYLEMNMSEKARWHLYKARRMIPFYQPVHHELNRLKRKMLGLKNHETLEK